MIDGTFVVGISGKAGSGKDTFANMLYEVLNRKEINIHKLAFADTLKDIIYELWGVNSQTQEETLAIVECSSGDKAVRDLLITIGPIFREIDSDVWVKAITRRISQYDRFKVGLTSIVIITDVRYPNEKQICDVTIRVKRDDAQTNLNKSQQQHESEIAITDNDEFDFVVNNNGTFDELNTRTIEIVSAMLLLILSKIIKGS